MVYKVSKETLVKEQKACLMNLLIFSILSYVYIDFYFTIISVYSKLFIIFSTILIVLILKRTELEMLKIDRVFLEPDLIIYKDSKPEESIGIGEITKVISTENKADGLIGLTLYSKEYKRTIAGFESMNEIKDHISAHIKIEVQKRVLRIDFNNLVVMGAIMIILSVVLALSCIFNKQFLLFGIMMAGLSFAFKYKANSKYGTDVFPIIRIFIFFIAIHSFLMLVGEP